VNGGGGVLVFFAALVAGAIVSACWMSASARVRRFPCKHLLPCFLRRVQFLFYLSES